MTPLQALKYHTTGAIERGEGEAIGGIPEVYCKIRFISKHHHGVTAGLILSASAMRGKTVSDLSRLFSYSEANKMDRFQRSPFFESWDDAFAYTFASKK